MKNYCINNCLSKYMCEDEDFYKECNTLKHHKIKHYVNTKKILEKIKYFKYTKPEISIILNMDYYLFLDCLYNRDFFTYKQFLDLCLLLNTHGYQFKE